MRTSAPEAGSVRTMPEFKSRRETQPRLLSGFAAQLAQRLDGPAGSAARRSARAPGAPKDAGEAADTAPLDPAELAASVSGPAVTPERAELLRRAQSLMGIPYVWGGDSPKGLDCSAFISRIWGVPRQTTDTLSKVADPITKGELKAGDVMNLPTWKDSDGHGHVRMFERWADAKKSKMWVYEETAEAGAKAIHRVIDYDPTYQPMRFRELAD